MGFRIKGANMFGFGKKEAPQPQQEEIKETGDQTIEKALNDPGFTEFLSKYPNRVELSDENAEEVKSRYERYQQVGKTIKEVQTVLASEMSSEISTESTSLRINPSEIEGVKDYLEGLAINDEAAFDQILKDIELYKALDQETDQLQAEIDQKMEALEKREEALSKVKATGTWKRWTGLGLKPEDRKSYEDARKMDLHIRRTNISERELDDEQLEVEEKESELNKKIEDFNGIRGKLMSSLGEQTGALQVAKDKLTKHLNEGFGTSLSDIDKLQNHYNELDDDYWNGELSFNYFDNEGFDKLEFAKKLDQEAEERVTEAIKNAVTTSPIINGQMSRLESTLNPYLSRERLGTKDQSESKEFVLGVVHELFAEYAKAYQEPDKRNKSWLLQRILEKNGVQANENFKSRKTLEEEQKAFKEAEEKKQTVEAVANPEDWQDYAAETDMDEEAPEEEEEELGSDKELTEIEGRGESIPNNPENFNQPPSLSNEELEQMDPNQAEVERQKKAAIENLANTTQKISNQKKEAEGTPQAPVSALDTSSEAPKPSRDGEQPLNKDIFAHIPPEQRSKDEEALTQAEINALANGGQPKGEDAIEQPQA